MMFLPEDKWSPRYADQFYTLRMKGHEIIERPPAEDGVAADPFGDDDTCTVFGFCNSAKKFPAVYYVIEVLRGDKSHVVLRRYSQFRRLCNKLDPGGEMGLWKSLPPMSGLFHEDTDEFLDGRMEGLYDFLSGLLIRQECVNNLHVKQFLGLAEA